MSHSARRPPDQPAPRGRPGRKLVIPWKETEEELLSRYEAEVDPRLRVRLKTFWLLRQGRSLREVSAIVEPPYATLQRWVRWYREGGLEEVLRRVPGCGAPGHPPKLTGDQRAALEARAESGAFDTIWDAARWVHAEYGVAYSYQGMHALLRRCRLRRLAQNNERLIDPPSPSLDTEPGLAALRRPVRRSQR